MSGIDKEGKNTPWIFVLTHGKAGEELVKSAEMILGQLQEIYTFSLFPESSLEKYLEKIENLLKLAPEGSIIMTDLFGGTPCNVAGILSEKYKVSVVTGLNIAMLVGADELRKTIRGEELAQEVISKAIEGCKNIVEILRVNKDDLKNISC